MSAYEFTTITVPCPTCGRIVIAQQPWDPGRVTTHLRVPEHTDVREALIEQPRCAGSHTILHLVDLRPLRAARARIKGVACGYDREESRCFDRLDELLKTHEVPRG